ncbi:MAG: hypothetical protein U1F53_03550 [Burkholderiaceae bacterium]
MSTFTAARPLASLLAATALLALGACAGSPPAPTVDARLMAGWQDHTRPLFYNGPGPTAGTTTWKVPALLDRGHYRVVDRRGNGAQLVDGYTFEIDGSVYKDIFLMLPSSYANLEAVEEKYVALASPAK